MNPTETFIEKAKKKHGDLYDYSEVNFVKNTIPVTIICRTHGPFQQTPATHLKGSGCQRCSKTAKLTTEEFITKAKSIHGDKYDYSETIYISNILPVKIKCHKHGIFEQRPNSHLSSKDGSKGNCPLCAKKILTKDEFIQKAREVHGDKYEYDNVVYVKESENVIIHCKIHGDFEQTPKSHLKGNGCSSCSGLKQLTTEEFIQRAKKVHGDRYNYSESEYINSNTKIKIICKEHGPFYQTHTIHCSGNGCSKCSGMHNKTTEEFITELEKIYGDKYDYKDVVYVNNRTKVLLHCPTHGEFLKTPKELLKNTGCPKCRCSKGEHKIDSILTEAGFEFETEKTFEGCFYKTKLRFDFYLPYQNLCIEFDGKQHYEPVKIFGGEESFKELQKRDKIKEEFCKNNGIDLIRIRYDEDIIQKIEEFFTPTGPVY